jgi:S-formylglutathione hydrolase
MSLKMITQNKSFGGTQTVYSHESTTTGCEMRFAIFLPPQASQQKVPVLYWLSGLTCTEENFIVKAGAQRIAAELGIAIVVTDTSPRGLNIPGEDASYDFGNGAGFYIDAVIDPWAKNYRMYSYVAVELPQLIAENFSVDTQRVGIFGHSMGGHGALIIALKNPSYFKSLSSFAPICSPSACSWGQKAFSGYLGTDQTKWQEYDATALIKKHGWNNCPILVDQGSKDQFLVEQLKPELLEAACKEAGVKLNLRMQEGYDHSYYFIASFIEVHLQFHHKNLS